MAIHSTKQPKQILLQRDGTTVALLRFGQPPQVKQNAEGRTLLRNLAMRRFVYDPQSRQMAIYPEDERFRTDPRWWLLAIGEATWPKYTMVTGPAKKVQK